MNYSICSLIVFICLWYVTSSLTNIIGKHLLKNFPHPLSVTIFEVFNGWIYSIPLMRFLKIPQPITLHSNRIFYSTIIVPLAIGKCLSQLMSQISLRFISISYSHTIKALMPLFTVVLSRIILSERSSKNIYFSLIPIVFGVVIASFSEFSFNSIGLTSALCSTALLSIQNIYSKKTLKNIEIHHLALLSILSKLSWCLLIPFWFLFDGAKIDFHRDLTFNVIGLICFDGLCNFFYNVMAFTMISRLSPVSYAIASSSKRLVVIIVSIVILHNPVSKFNLFGVSLSIFGVVLYNKVKYDEKRNQRNNFDAFELTLPFSSPTT